MTSRVQSVLRFFFPAMSASSSFASAVGVVDSPEVTGLGSPAADSPAAATDPVAAMDPVAAADPLALADPLAVAGNTINPIVWTADMILEQGRQERPQQPWTRNNQALKWFRWRDERPAGEPRTGVIRIDLSQTWVQIGAIEHDPSNELFHFDSPAVAGHVEEWSWKQFLVALRPADFRETVGLGITEIAAFATPGSYDHHRHHAEKEHGQWQFPAGVRAPIWDFKVTRADGSELLLHPRWRGNKLNVVTYNPEEARARAALHPPRMELGGTEGPGTFRRYAGHAHPDEISAQYVEGIDPVRDAHRRRHLDAMRQGKAAAAVGAAAPPAGVAAPAPPPARKQAGPPPPPAGRPPAGNAQVPGPPQGGGMPPRPHRPVPTVAGTPCAGAVPHAAAAAAADDTVWHRGYEYWHGGNGQWWWKDGQSGRWHRCLSLIQISEPTRLM
jgi:hypothetical protein